MKTPKRIGPGMEPTTRRMMLCSPSARLLSSSRTALSDATTLGIVAKNVRKTPQNWTMMKGMRSPQSLSQVFRSADPPWKSKSVTTSVKFGKRGDLKSD